MNKLLKELIALVRDEVAKRPDTVYLPGTERRPCSYDKGDCSDETVGCIFGQVILNAEGEVRKLGEFPRFADDASILTVMSHKLLGHAPGFGCDLRGLEDEDAKGVQWCAAVQAAQDKGKPWGDAVAEADELYPLEKGVVT